MKPLAAHRPVLSRNQHRACTLSVSWAELEQRLGPPLAHDEDGDGDGDGDGLGPWYRWEFHCDCGLELRVDLPRQPAREPREAVLWMEHLEVEHALAHLGLSTHQVLWRADMEEPLPLEGWAVVRQDDSGDPFDICVLSVRDHAECMARLMEARAPGQSYDIEPRGIAHQRVEPSRRHWALLHQEEHALSP